MSGGTCQHCGCSEIDTDPARGDAVCTNCGSVLEDNIIVAEVQFEEGTHGASRAIGQLVTSEGHSSGGLNLGYQHGMGRESRAITLQKVRRKIVQVAEQLRLNQHCIDTAYNFYKMALSRHMTRGRKQSHLIAACVYMVCRIEGTPHMLLDLSDVLQVNVYELGKTYLRISSALCINIPAIDPCLYIVRFAHRLEFGERTHEVSMTALRLVQRMKRDWMHTGRRPSGLCGAALLVAAHLHNFNRTVKDIIKVVKVCQATLKKRLTEFGDTPSSRLTIEEFMTIDLEEEQDPPSFKAARKKQKLQQLDDQSKEEMSNKISQLQRTIERALEERQRILKGPYSKYAKISEATTPEEEEEEVDSPSSESQIASQFVLEETIESIKEFVNGVEEDPASKLLQSDIASQEEAKLMELQGIEIKNTPETLNDQKESLSSVKKSLRPTAASIGLKESIEECMKIKDSPETTEGKGDLDLTGIDDEELDGYIMTAEEAKLKSDLWMKVHADYLQEQKEKQERKEREKEESSKSDQKKRKRRTKKKVQSQANTAGEAIEKMLQEKKISTKINYDVLKSLKDQDLKSSSPAKNERVQPSLDSPIRRDSKSYGSKVTNGGVPPSGISNLITSIISTKRLTSESSERSPESMECNQSTKNAEVEIVAESELLVDNSTVTNIVDEEDKILDDIPVEDPEREDEDLEEEFEDETDAHLSVAQLLGHYRGENLDDYGIEIDEYYE